jgi:hypothetical protein
MQTERRREMVIEVYTDTHCITGCLSTEEGRLSDTLNYEVPHILVLADVSSRSLERPEESPTPGGFMHLDTMAIAFAFPCTPEPSLEERQQTRMFDYVEKERHRAVAKVPPFQFEGYLHLPKGNDVQRSLWELTPAFVPLSDARISLRHHPEIVWQREIVILNRRRAQIMLPGDRE